MRIRILALLGVSAAILAAAPVAAQVVYDNGPINGTISGWTIWNFQYVTDSFTLTQTTTITGFTFGGWTSAGGQITALDYGFGSSAYGVVTGNTAVTAGGVVATPFGGAYDVRNYTGSVAPITLGAGTYYFTLTNATTTDNNYAYWDINNGPSTMEANGIPGDNVYGPTSSDAFTLLGSTAVVQPSVPEPASWALMVAGFGMVGGAMRARKRVSVRFA